MKRVFLSISLLSVIVSSAQTIYWDFETAAPKAITVSGLTVSNISYGNNIGGTTLISNESASSGYAGSSGNKNAAACAAFGTLNTSNLGSTYFEFTLTPDPGNVISLHAISFASRSTSTGPLAYSIRSNLDAYTSDIAAGTFLNDFTWRFFSHSPLFIQSDAGAIISFRIYVYNGSGTTPPAGVANWRIDDLSLTVTVAPLSSLPVKFGNIKASQTSSGVHLQWSNLNETNVSEYKIERSATGTNFNSLNQLTPVKNNGGKADYQFLDPTPLNGNNFYRIKAVDRNSSVVYTDIIRVNIGKNTTALNLYPNPVRGRNLILQMDNLPPDVYSLRIYNSSAQLISSQTMEHKGGSVTQMISINDLKSGLYFLEINGAVKCQKQFVVQ